MNISPPLIKPLELQQLKESRERLELHRRKKFQKILTWFIFAFSAAILLFVWDIISSATLSFASFGVMLLILLAIPLFAAWHLDRSYRRYYTEMMVPEFLEHYNKTPDVNLTFSSWNGVSSFDFNSCGLFRNVNEYKSFDLIKGTIGETSFECSQVQAVNVQEHYNSKGQRYEEKTTIFQGLFFMAEFNKEFKGRTFVIPDSTERLLGNMGHSLQNLFARERFGNLQLASMENPNFERCFAVYTSDQIEARYLLTPFLMQQILEFQQACNCDLHLSFNYGKLCMALTLREHWINPPSITSHITTQVLESTQQQLLLVLGLIDQLGLNTRIWGK